MVGSVLTLIVCGREADHRQVIHTKLQRLVAPSISSDGGPRARFDAQHGTSFKKDLINIGTSQFGCRFFGATQGVSIRDEEGWLIDKVFSIGSFAAQRGPSFKTDFPNIGTSRSDSRFFDATQGVGTLDEDWLIDKVFSTQGVSVLNKEWRLIDKVFSIGDKDNLGFVDMEELQEMFKLFGMDAHYLTTVIQRTMMNGDKDSDCMISPTEFYQLLVQNFDKGLIDKVFRIGDTDNLGFGDMFKYLGMDTYYLTTATQRIMMNGDKDFDCKISPTEFHQLLLQKFEEGDPKAEILADLRSIDKHRDGQRGVDELYETS